MRNGYALMWLVLAVFIGISRTVSREMGPVAGWAVFGVLAGGLGIRFGLTWLEQQKFAKQVNLAITALDERRYRECLKTTDEAIARARKWKFTPDDTVAMAFVIRAGTLWKTDDKQGALEASARAFTCMCGVESADVQLMIFDQLGWLLLETGYARKAIPILEAAVGLGHRAGAQPLQTASRLERAAMACHRVGVHANAAAAFGKAIDLMTKEKGPDALELLSGVTGRRCGCARRTSTINPSSFRPFC
jgi:hypothetical protein